MNTSTLAMPTTPTSTPRSAAGRWLPLVVAVTLGVAGPLLGGYLADLLVKVMVLAIFALSLQLLVGMTGLVSLGHAAYYGIGAYVTVIA